MNKPLPYKKNFFDVIICRSVLEHILNLEIFVDEIYRVLKPGGKIILRTDNAAYLPFHLLKSHEHNKIIDEGRSYKHKSDEDNHYHLFVESHLRRLFRKFRNIRFNYFYGGRNALLRLVARLLPGKTGAFHIEMEAVK